MNDAAGPYGNSVRPGDEDLEKKLSSIARALAYPPAPDVRRAVLLRLAQRRKTNRRLVFAGVLLALVLAVLFAVPPVRAAILNWIQIGAVRIFTANPTLTPTPTPAPHQTVTPRPTEFPTPTPLASVLDLSGETTLSQAQAQSFPLFLPAYPPNSGQPDHVFLQDFGGPVVTLVWMDKIQAGKVRLAISETNISGSIFQKMAPPTVENTTVNGHPAIWVDAPYMLITGNGNYVINRLISNGHTLIWTDGVLTFRLETGDDLAAAVKIAASLRQEP